MSTPYRRTRGFESLRAAFVLTLAAVGLAACASPGDDLRDQIDNAETACTGNAQCTNTDRPLCTGGFCRAGSCESLECPEGQGCRAGVCRNGNCANGGVTCTTGQSCVESMCRSSAPECTTGDATCGTGRSCVANHCVNTPPCNETTNRCPQGQRCSDGACTAITAECVDTADPDTCPSGKRCIGGSCVHDDRECSPRDPCSEGSHCDATFHCVADTHANTPPVVEVTLSTTDRPTDVPPTLSPIASGDNVTVGLYVVIDARQSHDAETMASELVFTYSVDHGGTPFTPSVDIRMVAGQTSPAMRAFQVTEVGNYVIHVQVQDGAGQSVNKDVSVMGFAPNPCDACDPVTEDCVVDQCKPKNQPTEFHLVVLVGVHPDRLRPMLVDGSQSAPIPGYVVIGNDGSSDPDQLTSFSYAFESQPSGSTAELVGGPVLGDMQSNQFQAVVAGDYRVTVTARDARGGTSATTLTIKAADLCAGSSCHRSVVCDPDDGACKPSVGGPCDPTNNPCTAILGTKGQCLMDTVNLSRGYCSVPCDGGDGTTACLAAGGVCGVKIGGTDGYCAAPCTATGECAADLACVPALKQGRTTYACLPVSHNHSGTVTPIGEPCGVSNECGAGAFCLGAPFTPDGECMGDCAIADLGRPCLNGGVCFRSNDLESLGQCRNPCQVKEQRCRPGYACLGPLGGQGYCEARECTGDAECGEDASRVCERTIGRCLVDACSSSGVACPGPTLCDSVSDRCLTQCAPQPHCNYDGDCTPPEKCNSFNLCSPRVGACSAASPCDSYGPGLVCDLPSGQCVNVRGTDRRCPSGFRCDPSGRCQQN